MLWVCAAARAISNDTAGLPPTGRQAADEFLLAASGGLLAAVPAPEAVAFVRDHLKASGGDAPAAAGALAAAAAARRASAGLGAAAVSAALLVLK